LGLFMLDRGFEMMEENIANIMKEGLEYNAGYFVAGCQPTLNTTSAELIIGDIIIPVAGLFVE